MAAFAMATMVYPSSAAAEGVFRSGDVKANVSLELMKPDFESGSDMSGMAGFLTIRPRYGPMLNGIVEVPFARSSEVGYYYYEDSKSQTALGNVYLGIEGQGASMGVFGEAGVRIPTAPDDKDNALLAGMFSDLTKMDAFAPKWYVAKLALGYDYKSSTGLGTRVKAGPSFWVTSDRDYFGDGNEAFMNYSGQLYYDTDNVRLSGGISGLLVLTEEDLLGDGANETQFEFAGNVKAGSFQPGIRFLVPLTRDLDQIVDFVIGFNIQYDFR
jgi:hypothetical protein